MKRIYHLILELVGDPARQAAAAKATLPLALLRILRLVPDELPALLTRSVSVLEWAGGLFVLFIFLRKKPNAPMENDNASVS